MSGIENNSRSIHFGPTKKLVCLPVPFRAKLPRLRCASLRMTRFVVFCGCSKNTNLSCPCGKPAGVFSHRILTGNPDLSHRAHGFRAKISYIEKREVLHWDMTYNQDLYYQDIYADRHWTASVLLRLHPVDKVLYDLNMKYIMPIGYHNVNLFLLDWDSSNYGHLCFNDMLDSFYWMENNDYFYARDYPYYATPYSHSAIPAQLFEETILPYFDISLDQFREMSLYDAYTDTYPWQDLGCDNILYYPELIPEVTDVIEVDENTIKLIVNVMCLDNKTGKLFVHEVTIRLLDDGKYQYIGNQITYKGDIAIPSAQARIPEQRFDEG